MTQVTVSKTGIAAEMDKVAQDIREKCCLDLLGKAFKSEAQYETDRKEWILGMHNAGMRASDLEDKTRPEHHILHAEWGANKLTGRDATLYKITVTSHAKELNETDKKQRTALRKRGNSWIDRVVADLTAIENPTLASDTSLGANSSGKEKYDRLTRVMACAHTAQRILGEGSEKDDLDKVERELLAAFTALIDGARANAQTAKSEFDKFAKGTLTGKITIAKKK